MSFNYNNNNNYDNEYGYNFSNNTNSNEIIIVERRSKSSRRKLGKAVISLVLATTLSLGMFSIGYKAGQGERENEANFTVGYSSESTEKLNSTDSYLEDEYDIVLTAANSVKPLAAGNTSVVSVVKAVADSVVSINTVTEQKYRYYYASGQQAGSGIIFAEDNEKIYIVTNQHVIDSAISATISVDDDKQAPAVSIVGEDNKKDIAVLSVTKKALAEAGIDSYKIATFGDSEKLEMGESVVAIGNALGEGKSATLGIVSAKNKKVEVDGRTFKMLQTDAAINPGNSGGALVDMTGKVIGVNTVKVLSGGIEGMGYSIPINEVKAVVEDIMKTPSSSSTSAFKGETPILGVKGVEITDSVKAAYGFITNGVYLSTVYEGSSAFDAGLKVSDIIVSFNGKRTSTMSQLSQAILETKVGDTVKVEIVRDNSKVLAVDVTMKS